jgi:hypothetical protein
MFFFSKYNHPGPESAPRESRPLQSELAQTQRRGSSSTHHNALTPGMYGKESQHLNMITRAMTADNGDDMLDVKRTGSGGLVIIRKKTFEEQEQLSRARATVLSDLYELSEGKETELNKKAIFKHQATGNPSVKGSLMTPRLAAVKFAKQEVDRKTRTGGKDSLLTAHEIKEQTENEELERRKAAVKQKNKVRRDMLSPASSFDGPTPRGGYNDENLLPDTVGYEIVLSNGKGSSVPGAAILPLPNRPDRGGGYRATNEVIYDLPHLC